MDNFRTNQHHNFTPGLPVEYYNSVENNVEAADITLIQLNRLFNGINGAANPYGAALIFAEYLLENGPNLLPCIIVYFVDKFKTLSTAIQNYVIENTPETNNYFRSDNGSDKLAFFANASEYRTRSSSVMSDEDQDPEILVSEHIKNKISPFVFNETVRLTDVTDLMTKKSNATKVSDRLHTQISNLTHNNFRTITPTTTHVEAANNAKQDIEANSYRDYDEQYRVNRSYKFKSNPYEINTRHDNTSEIIIDNNKDIVSDGYSEVYTTAGDKLHKDSVRVADLYAVMPTSRGDSNRIAKTNKEELSPITGSAGTNTSNLNDHAGTDPTKTYDQSNVKR